MRQSEGYLLFLVLIFLQIVSWISLYEFNQVALFYTLDGSSNQQFNRINEINRNLRLIEQNQTHWMSLPCFFEVPFSIKDLTRDWWQANACQLSEKTFYMVELLSQKDCVIAINSPNKQPFTVIFYRVTLAFFEKNAFAFLQQSTYALPSTTNSFCPNGETTKLVLGRQTILQM